MRIGSSRNRVNVALMLGVAALPLTWAEAALAQTASEQPAGEQPATAEAAKEDSTQLETIVVTARKRAETLEDAPLSVAAITGESMTEQGISTLEQISASIPSVQIGRSPQTASINIRGIGSGANRGFEQSVGMYIDGVYMARSRQFLQPMIDLERVEILRGPQGILFGKNTVAGAISIITAAPKPGQDLDWSVTGEAAQFGTYRATGMVSGSPTDTLGVRLAGQWGTTNGYVDNKQTERHEPAEDLKFLRGSVAWEPTEAIDVVARLAYTDLTVKGSNRVIRVFEPSLGAGLPLTQRIAAIAAPFANPDFGPSNGDPVGHWDSFDGNLEEEPYDKDHQKILNGSVNTTWDLGAVTLTSVSGYTTLKYKLRQDVDFLPVNLVQNNETEDFSQVSQELRASFETGPLSGIVGGYYEKQHLDAGASTKIDGTMGGLTPQLLGVPTIFAKVIPGIGLVTLPAVGRTSEFDQDAKTLSAFGELTWELGKSLRVNVGLRYSHDTKKVHKQAGLFSTDPDELAVLPSGASTGLLTPAQTALLRGIMATSFSTFPQDQHLSRTENHLLPAVNAQWDLPIGGMLYASWTQGFKSGGFNFSPDTALPGGAPGPGTEFEDETVNAWEVGWKGRFWDNRARASIDLFRSTFDNLQVTSFQGTTFVVGNAAKARAQGIEAEVEAQATDWLRVGSAAAYLDSKYLSFPGATCTISQLAAAGPTCTQDLSGRTTPFAPKWSSTLYADMEWNLSDSLQASARVEGAYRSSIYLDGDLDPNVKQGGYAKFNARIALGAENGRWEVAVYGRNLTNKATYTFSTDAPLGAGAYMASIEEPRVIGLQLTLNN